MKLNISSYFVFVIIPPIAEPLGKKAFFFQYDPVVDDDGGSGRNQRYRMYTIKTGADADYKKAGINRITAETVKARHHQLATALWL